jgi:hypothetical protein
MKFPDSAVRQIYFDKLVEMGRLPSNPTDQTIQTINEIPEADVLKLLRSLPGTGPTISKAKGGMISGIQTLNKGGNARETAMGGISRRRTEAIRNRNKAIKKLEGRDKGIATQYALSKADKQKRLEQGVGSLDRRINKAMSAGNLDEAKDLRSKQNIFSKKLADQRLLRSGAFIKDKFGRPIRTTSGNLIGDTKGKTIRDLSMQLDYINPTRRLVYKYPEAMAKMYPVTDYLTGGGFYGKLLNKLIPTSPQQRHMNYLNSLIGYDDLDYGIPRSLLNWDNIERMPMNRYPLNTPLLEDTQLDETQLDETQLDTNQLDDTQLDTIKLTKKNGINTINQPFRYPLNFRVV